LWKKWRPDLAFKNEESHSTVVSAVSYTYLLYLSKYIVSAVRGVEVPCFWLLRSNNLQTLSKRRKKVLFIFCASVYSIIFNIRHPQIVSLIGNNFWHSLGNSRLMKKNSIKKCTRC
jgi:hypothetical protein